MPGNEPGGGIKGGNPGGGPFNPSGGIIPGGPAMNGGGTPANGLNAGTADGFLDASESDVFVGFVSESCFLFCSYFGKF